MLNMTIPIDDHMVHRGHGVFESGRIFNRQLYAFASHVDRLFVSAAGAGIRMETKWSKGDIQSLVQQTANVSQCSDGSYRIFVSSGPGSFGIHSLLCEEVCVYIAVYGSFEQYLEPGTPIAEITISTDQVPMKPPAMAQIKSVDYLLNVLLADTAANQGGYFGIWTDPQGYVKEGSIASVSLITKEGAFVMPQVDDILRGTTVHRIAEICRSHNLVRCIEVRNFTKDELYDASEVIVAGGDTHIYPVVELDGRQVGDGHIGRVCQEILEVIRAEVAAVSETDSR